MTSSAFIVLLSCVSASAAACSTLNPPSEQELFSRAQSVFRARVTEAKLEWFRNPQNPAERVEVVEARYEIKEVFRGTPPTSGFVRDLPFAPGNCSLGILPGMEYVFFPDEHDFVLVYSGSFGFFNSEGTQVKPQLDALRHMGTTRAK